MSKKGILGDIEISTKEMQEALKANADGNVNYIGLNDDMLDFGQAESFVDEADGGKEFTIRITNNTDATQRIQFNEILENVTGHHLLKEGDVADVSGKKLTANGDPRSLDALIALIKQTPMRVRSMKLNVSDEAQLDEPVKYRRETPFMTGTTEQKIPSTYQDQNTNNVKTVEVSFKNWILGYDSTLLYSVRPGVTVNLTICFGASVSTASALRKKYNAAVSTAATYYARQNG